MNISSDTEKGNDIHTEFDSRWASLAEQYSALHKVNVTTCSADSGGIPLRSDKTTAYIDEKDSHSLIIGATVSKKTRLIGMPALRLFAYAGESFIATDPKAELYEKTYFLLKEKDYDIIVINLRDPLCGNCWNPLLLPYRLYWNGERDRSIEMIVDLASNILLSELSQNDPYWQYSASDFLIGLILILFECASSEEEINFKSLAKLRAQSMYIPYDSNDYTKNFNLKPYIKTNKFFDNIDKSSYAYACLSGTVDAPEKTLGSIISTFDQALRPFFSQDNLVRMLSRNDFNFDSFGKKKTALFLIMQDEKTTYHKLVSIFIKQCYEQLISEAQKIEDKKFPIRINFLLDEFSSLPRISDFPTMITASRSRNIRFNLIIQSIHQLKFRYGEEAETIKSNCSNWIFLTSKELPLLKELSELAGTKRNNIPLITVAALQRLKKEKGEALIFHDRLFPFVTQLLDIDSYPNLNNQSKNEKIIYPFNTKKIESMFDFQEFCEAHSKKYIKELFSGTKPIEEQNNNEDENFDFPKFSSSNSETNSEPMNIEEVNKDTIDIISKRACKLLKTINYESFTNVKIGKDCLSFLSITNDSSTDSPILVIGVSNNLDDLCDVEEIKSEINTSIERVDNIYSSIKNLMDDTLDEDIGLKILKLIVTQDIIAIDQQDIQDKLANLNIKIVCNNKYENNYILNVLPSNNVDNDSEDFLSYKEYIETVIDYFKSKE